MKTQWILALAMAAVLGAAMPRVAAAQQRWGTPAPQDRRFEPLAQDDLDDEELLEDEDLTADEELPPPPPRRSDRSGSRWDRDRFRRTFPPQRQPMPQMVQCYTQLVPPSTPFIGMPNQPCVTVTPMGPIQGVAR